MVIKEIIYEAMKRLDLDGDYDKDSMDANMPTVGKLIYSLNNVLSELAEICGFKTTERAVIKDGRISYDMLKNDVYKTIGVKIDGVKVKFKEKDLFIEVNGEGDCEVEYYYRIKADTIEQTAQLPPNIGIVTLALGVAADYCYNTSRLEEAAVFDKKYKTALHNALGLKRTVYVPIKNKW